MPGGGALPMCRGTLSLECSGGHCLPAGPSGAAALRGNAFSVIPTAQHEKFWKVIRLWR